MPIFNNKGINVVASIISIMLLAALGAGLAYFAASNQQTRIQQVTSDQAFYNVQAGLEFTLAQILEAGWAGSSLSRNFGNETITITRSGGVITVSSSKNEATASYSISDPTPTPVDCLNVDTGAASVGGSGNRFLYGLSLSRDPSCTNTVTITSLTGTTWAPDLGEQLNRIRIDGSNNFNGPAAGSGGTFDFGASPFIISDSASYPVNYFRWNTDIRGHNFALLFNYTYNGSPYSKLVTVNFLAANQADCFVWNNTSARLLWNSNRWKYLVDTTVQNTCPDPIIIDAVTTSWTPAAPSRYLENLVINGSTIFSGSAGTGVPVDVNHALLGAATQTVNYFGFDDEMLGRNYSVLWTFIDGTSKSYTLNLFASNQSSCLTFNTSAAMINPSNPDQLIGITYQNTCATDIGMTAITVSWAGEPARRLRISSLDDTGGTQAYNSNNASGNPVDFADNDLYIRNEDGVTNLNYLEFNNPVTPGLPLTIAFTMVDGTTASTTVTPSTMAQNLTVNTASATIGGASDRYLLGITITNSGTTDIIWDRVTVSWTPTSPSRKMQTVRVDGVGVYSGNSNSGVTRNITDVTILPAQTLLIDYIYFNGDMSGRTFEIEFIMLDGTSKTISGLSPPG